MMQVPLYPNSVTDCLNCQVFSSVLTELVVPYAHQSVKAVTSDLNMKHPKLSYC